MPRRRPAIMLYKGDWLRDPELSMCAPKTRGIWIDLLCAMDDAEEPGRLTGTPEQLAHVARCTAEDMVEALAELAEMRAAHVTVCNGKNVTRNTKVTVENRRILREAQEREKTRLRVAKHRRKKAVSGGSNADVPSSRARSVAVAVTSTTTTTPPKPPPRGGRGRGRQRGRKTGADDPLAIDSEADEWAVERWASLVEAIAGSNGTAEELRLCRPAGGSFNRERLLIQCPDSETLHAIEERFRPEIDRAIAATPGPSFEVLFLLSV